METEAETNSANGVRKGTLRKVLELALEVLVVGFVVAYLWRHRSDLETVWALDVLDVIVVVAFVLAGELIRSFEFKYVLDKLKVVVSYAEAYALTEGCTLLNYAPMNAGTIVRARALKRSRELSYTHYVSLMSAQALILLAAGGLLGGLSVLISPGQWGGTQRLLIAVCVASFVGPLCAFYVPASWFRDSTWWWQKRLYELLSGWRSIGRHPSQLLVLGVLSVCRLLLLAGRFWVCFGALGMGVSFSASILFAAVGSMMSVIHVTPGSLGVRELFVAAIATMAGLDFAEAVAAVSIERVASMLVVVGLGTPSLVYLKRKGLA
jgi:uncharacterized membrane protein YbhN (UPF0104 family)